MDTLNSRIVLRCLAAAVMAGFGPHPALGQNPIDPTATIARHRLESEMHRPLPEQYIWTAGDAVAAGKISYDWSKQDFKAAPHYFRHTFSVASAPPRATLYVAGPRSARVFLNGRLVDSVKSDLSHPLGMHVFATDVTAALRPGSNTLALEVVRGRGIVSASNSPKIAQQTFGEVLVVKIVPAPRGVDAPALAMSDSAWKSVLKPADGWEQPGFDDHAWPAVQTLGAIESDIDFFQWSGDAGLYDWPGYDGISPFLARLPLSATAVMQVFEGRGSFANPGALKAAEPTLSATGQFAVNLPSGTVEEQEAPSLMLDFGRESVGRLEFVSDSAAPAQVVIQYGESEVEAASNGQYLGVNLLTIPAHGVAHGPKSALRYAKIRFVGGESPVRFRAIRLDSIYYPVRYQGSFESSDPLLNRIWAVGAYTAHLCMQDDIWDAPKRDRGRWMGDVDVSGHVINKVFGDRFLMESTMNHLIGPEPVDQHVNGIAGYSAFWITGEADYYRHVGSREHLAAIHQRLIQLQRFMDAELDERDLYVNKTKSWPFVDWSPDLYGDTAEARRGTEFEFYKAYREGAWLLRELGDTANAEHFERRAAALKQAAERFLADPGGVYGSRWQPNAMAVLAGIAGADRYPAIWDRVLSAVGRETFSAFSISPYYNYYVISAMARIGHRAEALAWIRKYWGGMLEEGATSFWEAYDLNWPKKDFHLSLEADGTSGLYVSLAHGWSSGPTAWLMEEVLGVKPTARGFDTATIRPDLVDLDWAKGAEPTPHGSIQVSVTKASLTLDLPAGITAEVLMPVTHRGAPVLVNGKPTESTAAENGARARVVLAAAGHYEIRQ
jgi:alpha-L-rhamnosidase